MKVGLCVSQDAVIRSKRSEGSFLDMDHEWELVSAQVKSTLCTLFQYLTGCKDFWFNFLSLTCMCNALIACGFIVWFFVWNSQKSRRIVSYMSLYLNCQLDIQFVVSQSSRGVADGRAGIGWQGTLPSHLQITPPRTPLYARTDPHTFLCPSQVVTTHIPYLKESCREVYKKCELTACNKNGLKSGTWQEYLTHLSVNGTP